MTKKRDIEKLLDDGVKRLRSLMPGFDFDRIPENMKRMATLQQRCSVALNIVGDIAEETHDHWDVAALREALRDIRYLMHLIDAERQEDLDRKVMEDPGMLRAVLGLPEDADETEIMRVLAERTKRDDDDRGERVKEPVP